MVGDGISLAGRENMSMHALPGITLATLMHSRRRTRSTMTALGSFSKSSDAIMVLKLESLQAFKQHTHGKGKGKLDTHVDEPGAQCNVVNK